MFRSTRRGSTKGSSKAFSPDPVDGYTRRSRRTKKQSLPLGGRRASKAASSQAANTQPPVLVRNPSSAAVPGAAPAQANRRSKSKRRYDVALAVPGAEVRLPALPAFRLGWHYLSGLLAISLLGLLYYVWTTPILRVQLVDVQGLQRVSLADVNTVLGITGDPVFLINPEETHASLQAAFPEMSAITVEVQLPASVLVQVKERVPVLAWQKEGQELWVDADGFAFPPRGDGRPEKVVEGDLPVLDATQVDAEIQPGVEAAPRLDPQWVSAILSVGAQAPKKSRLVFDPEHGLGWEDRQGRQVFFGATGVDPQMLDLKLKIYLALLQRLAKKEIRPTLVSVEYVHAPYYRVER